MADCTQAEILEWPEARREGYEKRAAGQPHLLAQTPELDKCCADELAKAIEGRTRARWRAGRMPV